MLNQKELFLLDEEVIYLNGAAYSPALKTSVEQGIQGMALKGNTPFKISGKDHFLLPERVQKLFARLINSNEIERIAIIPAVSYGMAVVANNLHRLPSIGLKKNIVQIQDEFPNNFHAFDRVSQELGLSYQIVTKPDSIINRGEQWNDSIIAAITEETAAVIMPHVHWIYGIKFDLEAISRKCKQVGALLIIDGTQSLGVLDLDIEQIRPDALITASYKWLLGPYGIGLAYFGSFFDDGIPLEESWMHRPGSDNFAALLRYEKAYRPLAQRYNSGEYSNFILLPMLEDSLNQILDWGTKPIQEYLGNIIKSPIEALRDLGCELENEAYRANHLLGLNLPKGIDNQNFTEELLKHKVIVSNRGVAIRVSQHLYNSEEDLWSLVDVLKNISTKK